MQAAAPVQFNRHIDFCLGQEVEAASVKPFARRVWRKQAWERGRPPQKVRFAHRQHIRCAKSRSHRKAILRFWKKRRTAYNAHRREKLAERERLRYLPFGCGGGVRSAIPCGTMFCESGGSYTAANPTSTAYGKYQMLDTTYAAYCHACDWSPADQDRAAYNLYREQGGSPWVCA